MTWKPRFFFFIFSSAAKLEIVDKIGVVLTRLCCAIGQEGQSLP